MNWDRTYAAIDLKSFYASVECVERGLNPLATNLVVADDSRTDKTICLAVTPSLKKYGLSGRSRLFEVKQKVAQIKNEMGVNLEYIIAVPRMALYIKYQRIFPKYSYHQVLFQKKHNLQYLKNPIFLLHHMQSFLHLRYYI